MSLARFEPLFTRMPRGLMSRFRVAAYRLLGMKAGSHNRLERIRCRRLVQIELGQNNSLTDGCWLWPIDAPHDDVRIRIGNNNYFNRDVMIDACGYVEIGDDNMIGPGVYITDSNHTFGHDIVAKESPMQVGRVRIGSRCWLGAKVVILKDVELGDGCVVAAGSIVTKSFSADSVIGGMPARFIRSVESW